MKTFAKFIAWLLIVGLFYILGSLIGWSFNPGDWNGILRFLFACIILFITAFLIKEP